MNSGIFKLDLASSSLVVHARYKLCMDYLRDGGCTQAIAFNVKLLLN